MPYQYDLVISATSIVFIPLYIRILWKTYEELYLSGKDDFSEEERLKFIKYSIISIVFVIVVIVSTLLYQMYKRSV